MKMFSSNKRAHLNCEQQLIANVKIVKLYKYGVLQTAVYTALYSVSQKRFPTFSIVTWRRMIRF